MIRLFYDICRQRYYVENDGKEVTLTDAEMTNPTIARIMDKFIGHGKHRQPQIIIDGVGENARGVIRPWGFDTFKIKRLGMAAFVRALHTGAIPTWIEVDLPDDWFDYLRWVKCAIETRREINTHDSFEDVQKGFEVWGGTE
jgi:hypothetical protein